MRAFKATFRCAIGDDFRGDEDEDEDGGERERPATLEEIKVYLKDALMVSFDDEEYGNPFGLASVEVIIEDLEEISDEEKEKLYGVEAAPEDDQTVTFRCDRSPCSYSWDQQLCPGERPVCPKCHEGYGKKM